MKFLLRVLSFTSLLIALLITVARRENSGAWLAFVSQMEGDDAIYLTTGDGAAIHRISPDGTCAIEPRWSSDGKKLAFFSADCDEAIFDVVISTPASKAPKVAAARLPTITQYAWSPDSNRLVVAPGTADMVIVSDDGSVERDIRGPYIRPQWSPDGEWIYARTQLADGMALERIRGEAANVERVLTAKSSYIDMDWSPDGTQLVLAMNDESDESLYLMSPDGSALTPISIDETGLRIREPRWSPDGAWIAFLGGTSFSRAIYRIRPNGHDFEQVAVRTSGLRNLRWSPDSQWLVFEEDTVGNTQVQRTRADGSGVYDLIPGLFSEFSPAYAPVSGRDWHPAELGVAALGMLVLSLIGRPRR